MDKDFFISQDAVHLLETLMNCLMSFALTSDLVSETTVVTTQYISSLGIYRKHYDIIIAP